MIKIIGTIAAITLMLPGVSMAATVQIYTTVTNAHGGTLSGPDLTKCVTSNGQKQCIKGPATFTVPAGDYQVTTVLPAGYSAKLSAGCTGSIEADAEAACHIDWEDGAPIPPPQAVAPEPTPAPQPEPTQQSVPIPTGIPTEPAPQVIQSPAPEPQVIIREVVREIVREVPVESTTTQETAQKVVQLEERVGIVESAIEWIKGVLSAITSFLGL